MAGMTAMTDAQRIRLLRAKGAELEARVLARTQLYGGMAPIDEVHADVALVAIILADYIETRSEAEG